MTALSSCVSCSPHDPMLGKPCRGPLTIFHGMDQGSTDPIPKALSIIRSGALRPGGAYKDCDAGQFIFQHLVCHLMEGEKCTWRWPNFNDTVVSVKDYLHSVKDGALRLGVIERHGQRYLDDERATFIIPRGLTNEDPRTRTTCFAKKWEGNYYSSHISFHFALSQEQVESLDRTNPGGTAFFAQGSVVRCTQELPLTFATSIILGPKIVDKENEKRTLEAALASNNLSHIRVLTKYQDPEDDLLDGIPDIEIPPFDETVRLHYSEIVKLLIDRNGLSKYAILADSIFEYESLDDFYLVTRRRRAAEEGAGPP